MTPAGSWPTTRPGATGYSPRQMWESVPQIVVVVIFTIGVRRAAPRACRTSSMWMSRTSLKTAARIVSGINVSPSAGPARHTRDAPERDQPGSARIVRPL